MSRATWTSLSTGLTGPWARGRFENSEKFVEDEIQRYLADFPQIFSFDKQRELISQFKFLLNQAKAEKFGTQCDDAWSCLGPVLKQGIRGLNRTV